jgi:flagellar assembly protein FliH
VKKVHINNPSQKEAKTFGLKSFKGFSVDGTYTQQELDEHMAKAKAQGAVEGAREAEMRLAAPLHQALENLERVMDELSHFRRELFKESEKEILELIRAISKKVVFKELALDANLLQDLVGKAISLLEKQKRLSITINTKDFEIFKKAKEDFLQKFKGLEDLSVDVDHNVEPGSALVKSQTVELDVKLGDMVDHLLSQISAPQNVVHEVNDEGDNT